MPHSQPQPSLDASTAERVPGPETDWAARLTDAVRVEAVAVRQLRELAERQGGFVADGRIDLTRSLLAHRWTLIDRIRESERQIREAEAHGTRVDDLPDAVAEELRGLQAAIRKDLGVVRERDAADSAVLQQRRDEAAAELARVSGGRTVRRAYAARGPVAPRFGDRMA
jgi:hypothetical protein